MLSDIRPGETVLAIDRNQFMVVPFRAIAVPVWLSCHPDKAAAGHWK
jgi:hypothetical protein